MFLRKLTLEPSSVTAADVEPVRAAGVSDAAIADAIAVCATFNIIDRVADALAFDVPPREAFDMMAPVMYQGDYSLPV